MSKIATYNNYYRNNESISKSKSFATTSISSIYHLNSKSPTLEEILLNEAMDSETKTIKENIAEKSLNPSFVKPTNKFGFSSFAMPKRLVDNTHEQHKHEANSNEKYCFSQKSEIDATISIIDSFPAKTIKNHDEISLNPNKIVRPNTAMSIQDLTYNSRLTKPLNESNDNHKSFVMARPAGVVINTDKFGFNQNAAEKKSDFNPTKTNSINQSNASKNFSKLARPNTAMNAKTFDYNSHIRSPKAEEKKDNFSYYLKGDTALSSLKINKQTIGVGVQNNNNKDAFGYNKKIKAIAKDLLTFIKEEKILKDAQAEEKYEKEAFKFSSNNMSKTIVETQNQNSFDLKNQGYLSYSSFPIPYKSQATRTTYETLTTPMTKESIQGDQSLPQSHHIEGLNSKFGFKAKPIPSIIKQSPQTAQFPSIKTKTFAETSSIVNKGLVANELEEINSSKKNYCNPFTRTIYETSVYSDNNDVSKINQTVFTKQNFPLYLGNKPVSIDSESSNTSNNSLENFDCNASVRNFLEENGSNDSSLKKESSNLNLNKTHIDSMHQYLPNKQTESIFETQFKQSFYNTKADTNIEKQINDVEKMVLIKGAITMKSQNNSEFGLNISKSLRSPEGNSYYFIEETPHKNEIAPLKTDTQNIFSPKIDSLNNYTVKETELNFQTTNNELDFKLEKLTEKVDKLIQKGTIQHQSEKIESLPKKYQLTTKPAMKLLTNLSSSSKINKNLPTLNSISKQSRTILETSKKNDESVKTVKKSIFSPSLSSKIGGRTGEINVLKGNTFEQAGKNKFETKDAHIRQSKLSVSSKTIIEKPLINKTSTQVKEPLKRISNIPTKSILEKPIAQKIAHTSNMPTRTLNESYSKNLASKLKPTQTQSKVFPERKTSFGYSKPDNFEASLTIMDSNQKKISELENSIKKSFLQSSLTTKKVKTENNTMSSKGSISYLPTQSFLESSSYSRSLTASKDFPNKIKQSLPSRTILEKTASQNQFSPQSKPNAKPNESIYDIRNAYLPTKSIIEKPKAYSTKPLTASLKQKENNVFSSVQKAEQSMPSKTITERRSSFGFIKGKETKLTNPGLKSSEILIDQLVISLEKHEKEQQKRSQFVSHLGIKKGQEAKETFINNYGNSGNSNDCDEIFFDTLSNTEEPNHSQSQKNIIKIEKKNVKSVEDKKGNYFQNFKPKAVAIRGLEQKGNNINTGNQGLKSSIFLSKNLQQKQPVADRKQTKAKQTQKNTKQSGYLSCRSRTFSNLDVVLEVEREEYSRCSDDSKSTIKTWSIATTANDQEKSFSSFEDVKKLTKEENLFLSDETKRHEDTSELIRESVKSSDSLALRTESSIQPDFSLDTVEKTAVPERDEINDIKSESNIEQSQPDVKKKIETLKENSTKNNLCSEQGICNLNLVDEIFKYIEKDSEKVSVEQVLVIFEKLNSNFKNEPLFVSNGEMEIFVRKLDSNSDGFIDLKELLLVCDQFENF